MRPNHGHGQWVCRIFAMQRRRTCKCGHGTGGGCPVPPPLGTCTHRWKFSYSLFGLSVHLLQLRHYVVIRPVRVLGESLRCWESHRVRSGATAHPLASENDPILQSIAWCRHSYKIWCRHGFTTIYSIWCVGSTLVRNSHSIPQEWREECTNGLFFASGTSGAGLCGAMACGEAAQCGWPSCN